MELAEHIKGSIKNNKISQNFSQSNIINVCKKDQVVDFFRDISLNNEHFYTDFKQY